MRPECFKWFSHSAGAKASRDLRTVRQVSSKALVGALYIKCLRMANTCSIGVEIRSCTDGPGRWRQRFEWVVRRSCFVAAQVVEHDNFALGKGRDQDVAGRCAPRGRSSARAFHQTFSLE